MGRQQEMQNRQITEEEARMHLQHIYAPPIPSNPPPTCVHHPHETFVLPAGYHQRIYPQFGSYPAQQLQSTTTPNKDLIRFSASSAESKNNFSQNNNQHVINSPGYGDYNTDNGSETSCSGCSHCSALSGQTLETNEGVDRRTLLRYGSGTPPLAQLHFVASKHVYI